MDDGVGRVLVLQHIACEPPGVYEDVLVERGFGLERVELDEGDALPDWRGFAGIVAMGGPMGAYEVPRFPWLAGELETIADAVHAGVPFFGVCLGAQLLAAALGADVRPGPAPEVGILPVELTGEGRQDPLFASLPRQITTLQWHGDTFDLPEGAVRLAHSRQYENQAFRWGELAYGLQFHIEVSEAMAEQWGAEPTYAAALDATLGEGALPPLMTELRRGMPAMHACARSVLAAWLDSCVIGGRSAQSTRT